MAEGPDPRTLARTFLSQALESEGEVLVLEDATRKGVLESLDQAAPAPTASSGPSIAPANNGSPASRPSKTAESSADVRDVSDADIANAVRFVPGRLAVTSPSLSLTEIDTLWVGSQVDKRLAGTSMPPPAAP